MAAISRNFRVYHKLEPPYSVMLEQRNLDDTLLFESNAVTVLSSAETDTIKKSYNKVIDAYGCLGVLSLNVGGEDNILYLVLVTGCVSVGKIGDSEIFCITNSQFVSLQNWPSDEERIVGVRNLFNSRTFYFAWASSGQPWDLTLCAQRKIQDHSTDSRFFWNRSLHAHLQRYGIDCSTWLFKTICGGVEIRTVYAANRQAKACLISRLSCERAGTRFNVRGTNDDGHVANFCETEQVIFLEDEISSFLQTRGSVPLFWEQPGIQVGSHKVKMSRGYEASAPAFERHLAAIKQQYGEQVMVNLLGQKEGEHMLSQAFINHHRASVYSGTIPLVNFDYHTECRGGNFKQLGKLKQQLMKFMNHFDYFYSNNWEVSKYQVGTVRTNCLDCLDRTNAVQSLLGLEILPRQLESLGLAGKSQMVSRFLEIYKTIWTLNGDHISKIYAGTGALGGGRSKASDAARSATRTIQNNFLDNTKQEAIDILLLGSTLRGELADKARALLTTKRLTASPNILYNICNRYEEYTSTSSLKVFVGTWNVNGGKHFRSIAFKHQSLTDWLLDAPKLYAESHPGELGEDFNHERPIDVFAIGFEEMVDLNASNIMSASQTNSREWEKYIQKMISRDHKYILLTKVQLVGVLLYLFIRPHLAPAIRDVAIDNVKTGLKGAAGNKGGVAIRFLVNSTSMCFVCAHLAAGQSQISDRNSDYAEITRKMAFPMGRVIPSHDYVFWCGDFNYRIDLPNDEVKELIRNENWGALQAMDQLNIQREKQATFQGFMEGQPNFAPTYRYDLFCDDYDTSEKHRCPAWTDRVLWRHNPFIKYHQTGLNELRKVQSKTSRHVIDMTGLELHLLPLIRAKEEEDQALQEWPKLQLYTRSELKTSDHRPVFALFDVEVLEVKESERDRVYEEELSQQGPQDGTVIIAVQDGEFDDDLVDEIVGTFSSIGEIILVRFVGEDMWLIFKTGQMALAALAHDNTEILERRVSVKLKTDTWREQIQGEMKAWTLQQEALFNTTTNSLLGEDLEIADIGNYDSEGEEDEEGYSSLEELPVPIQAARSSSNSPTTSGSSSPADAMLTSAGSASDLSADPPSRPPPPGRPRPPAPTAARRETTPPQPTKPSPPSVADTVIVPEPSTQIRSTPPEPKARPTPPQRPGPPVKPPPPQRPSGGPTKSSSPTRVKQTPAPRSANAPAIKQPLGPQAIGKIKSKQQHKISKIGLPTNVSHMGHASSPEEAAALIQKLMADNNDLKGTLPAPLKPGGGLKPSSGAIPRSKTSDDIPSDDQPALAPPAAMPRFHSVENLSSAPLSLPSAPPTALPRQDSGDSSRPRPAPRRNVQSCVIEPTSPVLPPVAPRPLSVASRGGLPPVPVSGPETSSNYYSSIVDQSELQNSEAAKVLLNGCEATAPSSEYGTAWGGPAPSGPVPSNSGAAPPAPAPSGPAPMGPPPAVPKRKDIPGDSLLDKPLSPKPVTRDPFSTNITAPLVPVGAPPPVAQVQPQAPSFPVVPPRPSVQSEQDRDIFINKDDGLGMDDGPGFSPPPSPPPTEFIAGAPVPPPRTDSDFDQAPTGLGTAPVVPSVAPPPVPKRPPGTFEQPTNQDQESSATPPIPARPAPPPPVPRRPPT